MEQLVANGRSTPGPVLKNDVSVDIWKRSKRLQALDQASMLKVVTPQAWQVFQRQGHVPQLSHSHNLFKPARGFADIPLALDLPDQITHIDVQVIAANNPNKVVVPWLLWLVPKNN